MGSKKHKKHKSERRDRYEEYSMDRPSGLKLILKVGGSNSTPEHGNDSPSFAMDGGEGMSGGDPFLDDMPDKPKKSKKKKKKKDREKKHKHHKEKRHRHREDSSQEELSYGEENSHQMQENILRYSGITTDHSAACHPISKAIIPMKIEECDRSPSVSPVKSITDSLPPQILIPSPGGTSTLGTASTPGSTSALTPRGLDAPKTPSSSSESGREPRSCVLKLKQSRSPVSKLLDYLLRSLEKRDPHQFFAWPVTDDIAPGYSSIITKPMDFSTMRQKIDDNEYNILQEFSDDFRLMCENAIRYNHVETVYHKAAKRLLHVGTKMLSPDHLMRSLKPLPGYMRELTTKELGFDMRYYQGDHDGQLMDSADEGASTGADEPTAAQIEEDEKRKALRLENDPKSRFEPYVDDLTAEEILAQVQSAALMAKKKISAQKRAHNMGFLRQNKDGTTSMNVLLRNDGEGAERVVKLGDFIGKLQQGTGQLQGFREDRRNAAKIVKPLNYGAFSSFAPIFDSRFSNLSKEETDLVLSTYGDETGAEYTDSIMDFTKDSSYASVLANRLLDYLTFGEHRKAIAALYESQYQRYEQAEIEKAFPDRKYDEEEEYQKYKNTKVDFANLRTLSNVGIDTSFLNELEESMKKFEDSRKLHEQLTANLALIEKLHSAQHDRLSQPLPQHLANVTAAGPEENLLANQITANLTEIAKKLPPSAISNAHGLRKAMGLSNVGLPPLPQRQLIVPDILQETCTPLMVSSNTSEVPMDIETDTVGPGNTCSVDLESELREFLENSGEGITSTHPDDNCIEQMLLN